MYVDGRHKLTICFRLRDVYCNRTGLSRYSYSYISGNSIVRWKMASNMAVHVIPSSRQQFYSVVKPYITCTQ